LLRIATAITRRRIFARVGCVGKQRTNQAPLSTMEFAAGSPEAVPAKNLSRIAMVCSRTPRLQGRGNCYQARATVRQVNLIASKHFK
jgi:hypothetical protein